ncbi:GGDEF domain-containing protein [Xanthobacter autotrophicus]|uniref:GGDEF domain-containing protein n=1 Tax=Xanthobacter TaxID=279 RepID=UPI0024ABF21D|nr:GGDEF domain-containing protein [Xanthobacter autotrophicus]MDI4664795.1 GGDEF domain-containing protein [Xanthobacter autotrophicus]
MSEGRLYLMAGPAVAFIVACVFLFVWLHHRERRYVPFFAVAFCAYAIAALSQLLRIPPGVGLNTMVSALIYTFGIFCLVQGVMARFGKAGSALALAVVSVLILGLLYYFMYVDRNLVARIYVQNFGYGLMFLFAAVQIFGASGRRTVDRILFWVFLLFGLHFFVRTMLTMSISPDLFVLDRLSQEGADPDALARMFSHSPFWQVLNFSLLVSGLLVALALLGAIAVDAMDDLKRQGGMDPLTGLANRRGFDDRARELMADAARHPLSLVYCDIDRFKAINDTFGHATGDLVLATVGGLIARLAAPWDVAARRGGEEFVMLLAGTDLHGACGFAERMRTDLRGTAFSMLPAGFVVTASFGVAERRRGEDLADLLHRADELVYAAKRAGRDCILTDAVGALVSPVGQGAA